VALLVDAGIRTFIDLTEAGEHGLEPYHDLVDEAAARRGLSLRHRRFPIPDYGVAASDKYGRILDAIQGATAHGGVYVHCWGGIGRTGTVVGCLLVDAVASGADALWRLQTLRHGTSKAHLACPQNDDQRAIVTGWSPASLT
jgi:protein-tyrosine phosphatase